MSGDRTDYFAIGLTHSMETVRLLEEILHDPRFRFSCEGTGASGFELYVQRESVPDAVEAIRNSPRIHIEGHIVSFYARACAIGDGTRYGRLIAHLKHNDSNRPA